MASLQLYNSPSYGLERYRFEKLGRGCYTIVLRVGILPGVDIAIGTVERLGKSWRANGLAGATRREAAERGIEAWFQARDRLLPRPAQEKMCPCQFCLRCCCKYTPGLEGNVGICSNLEDGECDCEREIASETK